MHTHASAHSHSHFSLVLQCFYIALPNFPRLLLSPCLKGISFIKFTCKAFLFPYIISQSCRGYFKFNFLTKNIFHVDTFTSQRRTWNLTPHATRKCSLLSNPYWLEKCYNSRIHTFRVFEQSYNSCIRIGDLKIRSINVLTVLKYSIIYSHPYINMYLNMTKQTKLRWARQGVVWFVITQAWQACRL